MNFKMAFHKFSIYEGKQGHGQNEGIVTSVGLTWRQCRGST